jgi:hypothetical protein
MRQEVTESIYRRLTPVFMDRMREAIKKEEQSIKDDFKEFEIDFSSWSEVGLDMFWFSMYFKLEEKVK